MSRGLFITFEGGDGAGKTTQVVRLADAFQARGLKVYRGREPGGTPLGIEIRKLLLHTEGDMHPRTEALLYAADRAENINRFVRPALEAGIHVLQDRYIDSSVAYQGAGRSLGPAEVRDLSVWATDGLIPDLTVLLDLDPHEAAARVDARAGRDRIESAGDDFRARLRAEFIAIAESEPERFLVLDASRSQDDLFALILERVTQLLNR